jgi:hypothetical protein
MSDHESATATGTEQGQPGSFNETIPGSCCVFARGFRGRRPDLNGDWDG